MPPFDHKTLTVFAKHKNKSRFLFALGKKKSRRLESELCTVVRFSIMANLSQVHSTAAPLLTMQDELGITYLINSAQQFWSGKYYSSGLHSPFC